MDRYAGIRCPHCGNAFTETDSVVVCPDCGAPYHRSCFEEMGGVCKFADRHGGGFAWQAEEPRADFGEDPLHLRCGRCGTLNDSHNLFCDVCGTPLRNVGGPAEQQRWEEPPRGPFRTMGYDPYTTPYGGLDPDGEISGVPVKDLAIFVGENTAYYLPRFKEMSTSGRSTINWAAFLLEFIFLLYRKMYAAAAVIFVVSNLISLAVFFAVIRGDLSALTPETYGMFTMVTYGISFALRAVIGLFFNRFYMAHCLKKIRRYKESSPEQTVYYETLTKKGSVSRKAVIIVFCVYMALSLVLTYAATLTLPMM